MIRHSKLRLRLREKLGDLCYYCACQLDFTKQKSKQAPNSATVEHLISAYQSENYKKNPHKVVLACYQCNHGRAIKEQSLPEFKERILLVNLDRLEKKVAKLRAQEVLTRKQRRALQSIPEQIENIKKKL